MLHYVRSYAPIAFTLAYVRTRLEPVRERSERGASAIEWVIIAAICVVAALAIGTAIMAVVTANKGKIEEGTNLPG